MQTKEIQQNEWPKFFDNFSRKHEGEILSIEILGTDIGAQLEEKGLALEGITAEAAGDTIVIMAGGRPDDHVTRSVNRPTGVSIERTDEGDDAALAIKAADGTITLLRFRLRRSPEPSNAVPH
jgi:hypothetical protein